MMTSGRSLEQECAELIRENNALRTQRDELVKALEEAVELIQSNTDVPDWLVDTSYEIEALLTRIEDQP